MRQNGSLRCVLCQSSEETKITGAISTKDKVTAHQNCLLFSSGIWCKHSPQFDDLFGFSVEDVRKEVKRGNKLSCSKCKRKGATVGCEVRNCKKSFHYPCAIREGAEVFEDEERYGIHCIKHARQSANRHSDPGAAAPDKDDPGAAAPDKDDPASSKVFCLTCEETEGNVSLEGTSDCIFKSYCDKHAAASHLNKARNGSSATRTSVRRSHAACAETGVHSKRQLRFTDREDETPSKRKREGWKRRISDDSADSDEDEPSDMFAPLDSDLDESATPPLEQRPVRRDSVKTCSSSSGNPQAEESQDKNKDETITPSNVETPKKTCVSESPAPPPAYPPVNTVRETTANHRDLTRSRCSSQSPHQRPTGSPVPPSLDRCSVNLSPLATSPPSVNASSSFRPKSLDSSTFWKSCNAAGCTQAIFLDLTDMLKDLSRRIQSDQARQEDYDLALKVMLASGKLMEFVAKQQTELKKKEASVQKASAAMKDVVSALGRVLEEN